MQNATVSKDEVLELYRRADSLPLHRAAPVFANPINKFRVNARKFRLDEQDDEALAASIEAFGAALAAVDALSSAGSASSLFSSSQPAAPFREPGRAEPVVDVLVSPIPEKQDVPVDTSSPTYGVIELRLEVLDPNACNPRLALDKATLAGLTAQMKEHGFDKNHALIVRSKGNGRYEVLSGHHRMTAAASVGLESVPCKVVEMSDQQALLFLSTDNTQAKLTFLEHGLHSFKVEAAGVPLKTYAAQIGFKDTNLSRARRAAKVFQAVRASLGDDVGIGAKSKGENLAAIGRADPSDWEPMVRVCLAEKWTVARTREEVAQLTSITQKDEPLPVEPTPEPVNKKEKKAEPQFANKAAPGPAIAKAQETRTPVPLSVPAATFLAKVGPMAGEYVTTALLVKTFLDAAPDLAARKQREHVVRGVLEKLPAVESFLQMEPEELAILALVKLGVLVESAFKAA